MKNKHRIKQGLSLLLAGGIAVSYTHLLGIAIAASDELGILHISIFIYTDADVF